MIPTLTPVNASLPSFTKHLPLFTSTSPTVASQKEAGMPRRRFYALRDLLLASGLVLCAASSTVAQPMGHDPALMPSHAAGVAPFHPGPPDVLPELDLSEAQQDQVFRMFHEQAPATRERMKAARRAREELVKLSAAPSFDRERARALADAEAKAVADLSLMRAESMSRIRAILTPEQRARLDERRARPPRGTP
jgi:Spy/CpxP family protein refolding chaperone